MSLELYLQEVSQADKPLRISKLTNLSNLSRQEMELFKEVWPKIESGQRFKIVANLVELAEDNVELDFGAIFKFCLNDPDEGVRVKAIEGLWECEERSLIDQFIKLLREDRSTPVRAAAAKALGKFVMMSELEELRPSETEKVVEALFSVIEAGEQEPSIVRRRAIEAIGPLNTDRARDAIRQAYKSKYLSLRLGAVHAMGRNYDSRWLPLLLRELRSKIPEMRYEAAAACGELEDKRAVPYLANLLKDEDIEVQVSAIMALGQIGGEQAKRKLEEYLMDADEGMCEVVEDALDLLSFGEDPLSFG